MAYPKYRDAVWAKQFRRDEREDDPQVHRILDLLDTYYATVCSKCGGEKTPLQLVCSQCAGICPDPDHRENWFADAQPPMCPHCAGWLLRLDLPCLFSSPDSCSYPPCADARDAGGPVLCPGTPKIREGFFVYQLDTGYIGMTFNPSRRQIEHEVQAYTKREARRRQNGNNPIHYLDRYTAVVEHDRLQRFPEEYQKHWEDVRKSDKGSSGERRIKWLSPVLESRHTAWRCEWALKDYAGNDPSRFQEITAISSVPVLRVESAGLSYDSEEQSLFLGLKFRLSDDLGPSQIVPVQFYEIEQKEAINSKWTQIDDKVPPREKESEAVRYERRISSLTGSSWRIRAVNDVNIPRPWAELNLTDADMSNAMASFLGIRDFRFTLRDRFSGIVDLSWSLENHPGEVKFIIQRQDKTNDSIVEIESDDCEFSDVLQPDGIGRYSYQVKAEWLGASSSWATTIPYDHCVVFGGPAPGPVHELSYKFQDGNICQFSWAVPEWQGHSDIINYEAEYYADMWKTEGIIEASASDARASFTSRLGFDDHSYRIRAVNAHGKGPWSELEIPKSEVVESVRQALKVDLFTVTAFDVTQGYVELNWTQPGLPANVGYVLQRRMGNQVEEISGAGQGHKDTVPLNRGSFLQYRVRLTVDELPDTEEAWSPWLGIFVLDNVSTMYGAPSEDLLVQNEVGVLLGLDMDVPTRHGAVALSYRHQSGLASTVDTVRKLCQAGIDLVCKIEERNTGGLICRWSGMRCFVPGSLVFGNPASFDNRVGGYARLCVQEIRNSSKVFLGVRMSRPELILNEVASLKRLRMAAFNDYKVGQIVKGTVSSIKDLWTFVSLGKTEGLLHKSELTWSSSPDAEDLVRVGDELTLKVIRVNREEGKVYLSLKRA